MNRSLDEMRQRSQALVAQSPTFHIGQRVELLRPREPWMEIEYGEVWSIGAVTLSVRLDGSHEIIRIKPEDLRALLTAHTAFARRSDRP
jgi:hypothetical protein